MELNIYQDGTIAYEEFEVYKELVISDSIVTKLLEQQSKLVRRNPIVQKATIDFNRENIKRTINYDKKLYAHHFLQEYIQTNNNVILSFEQINNTIKKAEVIFYSKDSELTFNEIKSLLAIYQYFQ